MQCLPVHRGLEMSGADRGAASCHRHRLACCILQDRRLDSRLPRDHLENLGAAGLLDQDEPGPDKLVDPERERPAGENKIQEDVALVRQAFLWPGVAVVVGEADPEYLAVAARLAAVPVVQRAAPSWLRQVAP